MNHLVESSSQVINRLFVLVFENYVQRTSNKGYYILNVEIKDYNVMIDGKTFFGQPIKKFKIKSEIIRKRASSQRGSYKTGFLLAYAYLWNIYKMIAVDLSKQRPLDTDGQAIQQINFIANLERAKSTRIFFILEEAKETVFTRN